MRSAAMLKKLKAVNLELRRRRHQPIDVQGRYVQALIGGHVRYYGVPFNSRAIRAFRTMVIRLWKKWLSRRSQRGYLNLGSHARVTSIGGFRPLSSVILIRRSASAADLRQEPDMGNLYVRIRAGGGE